MIYVIANFCRKERPTQSMGGATERSAIPQSFCQSNTYHRRCQRQCTEFVSQRSAQRQGADKSPKFRSLSFSPFHPVGRLEGATHRPAAIQPKDLFPHSGGHIYGTLHLIIICLYSDAMDSAFPRAAERITLLSQVCA